MKTNYQEIIAKLKSRSNVAAVKGMARFGINPKNTLGVSVPFLRKLARELGKNHLLAQRLWGSGIHEARILAGMVDDIALVSGQQMDQWAHDFDSWDVCDQVCLNLFYAHQAAFKKCIQWSRQKEEYVRRAGFALMACLAVKDKKARDKDFIKFFPLIRQYATDERNYVRKSVNWALRQIGKRNLNLNKLAIKETKEIVQINSRAARWIAANALRELISEAVQGRLKNKI